MTHLRWLILDEADRSVNINICYICMINILFNLLQFHSRLLDLGFEHDLSFILSTIKEHSSGTVQKVLLSATLSQGTYMYKCPALLLLKALL